MGLFDKTDVPGDLVLSHELASVLTEFALERNRQDAKWGGPEHDDGHNQYDWLGFIADRIGMVRPGDGTPEGLADYRKRLVQAAALCVAAIESFDRIVPRG